MIFLGGIHLKNSLPSSTLFNTMKPRLKSQSENLQSTLSDLEMALDEWNHAVLPSKPAKGAKSAAGKRRANSKKSAQALQRGLRQVLGLTGGDSSAKNKGTSATTREASARARRIFRKLQKQIHELSK